MLILVAAQDQTARIGAFEVLTAVIAVIGLVLAVASLVWQIISWRLAGSNVKVKMAYSFPVGAGVPSMTLYSLTATNSGRLEVSVTGWGLQLPEKGATLVVPGGSVLPAPEVPHTLQPGHEATWFMDQREVIAGLRERHPSGEVARVREARHRRDREEQEAQDQVVRGGHPVSGLEPNHAASVRSEDPVRSEGSSAQDGSRPLRAHLLS